MALWKLTREDIEPLLEGLAVFGTGGGGSPAWGRAIMEHDLAVGRTYLLIPPADVPDEAAVVSGGYMGSVKVLDAMGMDQVVKEWDSRFELQEAFRLMRRVIGRPIDYVVPFELGGLNTPVILSLGARLGLPVVDGDALGRAAPETQMTTFLAYGISLEPMPLVDRAGNSVVVWDATDPAYADELGRWVVNRGGGTGANNHYAMSGRQLKDSVVPGTITMALEAGRIIQAARSEGRDPVGAFAAFAGGSVLLSGKVREISSLEDAGHYVTTVTIAGNGDRAGRTLRVVIKNETMAAWLDGRLVVILPDLLCLLDPVTGRGIMSVELEPGLAVAAVVAPCHPRLRRAMETPVGARAFSGARYGHPDLTYRPLEQLLPSATKPGNGERGRRPAPGRARG